MHNAIATPPPPINETVLGYGPGSPERASLRAEIQRMRSAEVEILPVINGKRVETGRTATMHPPHDLGHTLGTYHKARTEDVQTAIQGALDARHDWSRMDWTDRSAIFLKAADLLAGPFRDRMNAATMLGQSKNAYQAEIDAACEMIDFFRFNVHFLADILAEQPISSPGVWNRTEYRPLEGFVFAVSPFNFTSIAANLCTAPALMGNTVLWKPAPTQMYSAQVIVDLLHEAGLPPGVIQFVPGDGADVGDPVMASPDLAGLHFTGSTQTFNHLWHTVGSNLDTYKTYPRIVGETGGKDFIVAHESANPDAVATAIIRGSFEYQGQKCSAASRVYVQKPLWPAVRESLESQLAEITVGPPEDFSHFVNAVIDQNVVRQDHRLHRPRNRGGRSRGRLRGLVPGGQGYFVDPTVLVAEDPNYETMEQEIFGPVASVHVSDLPFDDLLTLVDETSPYALTGAVFSQDRALLAKATDRLADAAGNFYLNDKPTGAVVGQQPFGGARGSGTNDKAGSKLNLLRWASLRSIKETFVPATHFTYPFLDADDA